MPVFLPAAFPSSFSQKKSFDQHQLGERRAVLLLRDRGKLLAERRKARVGVGFRRRDGERGVRRGRNERKLLLRLRRRRALLRLRRRRAFLSLRAGGGPFCAAGGGGPSLPGRGNVPCAAAGRASIPAIKIVVETDRIRIVASSAQTIP